MFSWSLGFFTLALIASAVGHAAPENSVVLALASLTFLFAFAFFAITLILSPFWNEAKGAGRTRAGLKSTIYRHSIS